MNTYYYSTDEIKNATSIVRKISRTNGPELDTMIYKYICNQFPDYKDQINLSNKHGELILRLFCLTWNLEWQKGNQTYIISGCNLPKRYSVVKITESELLKCTGQYYTLTCAQSLRFLAARSNPSLFDRSPEISQSYHWER